uniref:DEP domain-containing protein n=1 Tax=Tanacetum cinerariifolium TaxID=118510 RepID=A0A6L2L5U4_TANCI|nr:DEP domain-containing protein [Tanacetum cinerariifolium]
MDAETEDFANDMEIRIQDDDTSAYNSAYDSRVSSLTRFSYLEKEVNIGEVIRCFIRMDYVGQRYMQDNTWKDMNRLVSDMLRYEGECPPALRNISYMPKAGPVGESWTILQLFVNVLPSLIP